MPENTRESGDFDLFFTGLAQQGLVPPFVTRREPFPGGSDANVLFAKVTKGGFQYLLLGGVGLKGWQAPRGRTSCNAINSYNVKLDNMRQQFWKHS